MADHPWQMMHTARFSAARASMPPRTPSTPSYIPASAGGEPEGYGCHGRVEGSGVDAPARGMASQWDPVSTAPAEVSEPSQRPKMFPIGSSLWDS